MNFPAVKKTIEARPPDEQERGGLFDLQETKADKRARLMNINEINSYLAQAREMIGDRVEAEIDYDNAVVAYLTTGMDIKKAIRAANQEHPEEALHPDADQWPDLLARYKFLLEHKAILKRLGMKE